MHASRVKLNLVPGELLGANSHSTVRTFGLEVRGKVVRSSAADLRISIIDCDIMTATGLAGTTALLFS